MKRSRLFITLTQLVKNIFSSIFQIFPNAHQFNPDRFLDSNQKFRSDPHVTTFSLGKRKCPGEVLARAELYIFVTSLLQKFKFALPKGKEANFNYKFAMIIAPEPYELEVALRSN